MPHLSAVPSNTCERKVLSVTSPVKASATSRSAAALISSASATTLMKEAMFHGVRTGVIHPGFVDTPLLQGMPEGYVEQNILPDTQLGRLIRPEEIADAICFMVRNSAVSGQLWADAGWHPTAA